jgi:hypothetical protein
MSYARALFRSSFGSPVCRETYSFVLYRTILPRRWEP